MNHLRQALILAILAGAPIALAPSAQAQNALDKNLQVGSGGVNRPTTSFADQLRQRNAIVTGNAAGGFSFRGDVGYSAPREFRGAAGSSDSFAFRRDSVISGLGGQGIRGTDALQYQYAYSTGQSIGGVANPLMIQRDTTGQSIQDINRGVALNTGQFNPAVRTADVLNPNQRIDTRDLSLLSLRSPAAYAANRGFVPSVLGTVQGQDPSGLQDTAMTASPLRGVTMQRARRADARPEPRPDQIADTNIAAGEIKERVDQQIDTRNDSRLDGIDLVRDRIAKAEAAKAEAGKRPADTAAADDRPAWQVRIEEVRKQLADVREQERIRRQAQAVADATKEAEKPAEGEQTADANKPAEADPAEVRRGIVETLRNAAGEPITALAPPGFDAYSEHMAKAQEHLAASRYFDAEQRFVAALGAKPGDVMSSIGRVHAQLGAGTFVSAAISLRQTFQRFPEIIAVRYAPNLLPTRLRFTNASERLRQLISEDPANGRDPGMLLAYMGYQFNDTNAVRDGLDAMDRALAAKGVGGVARDDENLALAKLLREVWTNPLLPGAQRSAQPGGANPK